MSHSENYLQTSMKFSEKLFKSWTQTTKYQINLCIPKMMERSLKNQLKLFYNRIIHDNFENLSIKWIKDILENNDFRIIKFGFLV